MHIIGGQTDFQTRHTFTHTEQRISLRQTLPVQSAPLPQPPAANTPHSSATDEADPGSDKDFSLFKALVEALIGKQIDTLDLNTSISQPGVGAALPAAASGPVLSADVHQISEVETTQVAASGQFATAEGGAISINLQYALERHYASASATASISDNRQAKDPLILNFDGRGVALDPQTVAFDLNSDGQAEALPTLAAGSAYLALDRNDNGSIDNGSELFGPNTNNGYAELSQFDSDGNGFIDSADPIFDKLRLFRIGEQSQTLADRDIGAIFLGSAASPARLTDTNNLSLGQLRVTGFYLTNSGGAGLVQELDLAV
ncbi:MAG TPA: hypothetical protein VLC91_10220 [Spongiibacteraceae bacterium]|nr:hypothetical protein [Spongiibacteraceae bacterium]